MILVGFILRLVFASASLLVTGSVVLFMLAAASREVGARSPRRLLGSWQYGIGAAAVTAATLPIAAVALATALRPTPWYDAHHAILLVV